MSNEEWNEYLEAMGRLPFVGYHKDGTNSFWAVEANKCVSDGDEIGREYAFQFLKFQTKYNAQGIMGMLSQIVSDMEKSPETEVQRVGFISVLDQVLIRGLRHVDIDRSHAAFRTMVAVAKSGRDTSNVVFLNARKSRK